MSLSRKLSALSTSSEGKGRLATLTSILVLASLLVLVLAVLPVGAGEGGPSTAGVQPAEIAYGGGSGGCFANFPGLWQPGQINELHINNPGSRTYTGPDGSKVTLTVEPSDMYFSFSFDNPAMAAFDVVVNGGSKNAHFDYDGSATGPLRADARLHAPTKGGSTNLYQLSHINICYALRPIADLSVTKWVSDREPNVGDAVTYEIEAINSGPDGATNVVVTDDLPDGVTVVIDSSTPSKGTFEETTGVWTIGSLAKEATATLEYQVTINEDTSGLDLTNTATITTGVFDPSGENDTAEATVTVNFCGQELSSEGAVFNAAITIFDQGNKETPCDDKYGDLFETEEGEDDGNVAQLNFPVFGDGTFAAFGDINKSFSSPNNFVPLKYKQGLNDSFEIVPWCGLREKSSELGDGNEFDPYLVDDSRYPTVSGISDPVSGYPAVSCKVWVDENAEGNQRTILLIQGDPFYR